ncbi:MAG: solute:sodium symporter family transporter, partial [Luminiphilus sp.]
LIAIATFISLNKSGEKKTAEDYFLAGRSLPWWAIGTSLIAANIAADQIIGMNGDAYAMGIAIATYEWTAAIALIVVGKFLLPVYLKQKVFTMPQLLSQRYDQTVSTMLAILMLIMYVMVILPTILWLGAKAVNNLTGLELIPAMILLGLLSLAYSLYGGLKAVAVSDTLNGIGLLIVGIAIPLLGFHALGEGSVLGGLTTVVTSETEKLNAIGTADDPTPFATLFTGMIFANLFYWCANQYVIQRTLAARNLAEGQRGVLLSGFFKVLVPMLMMLPGVIAFHLYGNRLETIDLAYPQLVRDVLPSYAWGFFLAVLLGAVFSSFNSLLNSAATLFCLDVYEPLAARTLTDTERVSVAKRASVAIALFSFAVAPMLQHASEGLWQVIRIFTGFYNIPVIAIVVVGLFTTRVPAVAAKVVIVFHVVSYGCLQFLFKEQLPLHFLHLYAILFVIEVSIMLVLGWWRPRRAAWTFHRRDTLDLSPWRYAIPCAVSLLSCVVALYLLFSPVGLVGGVGPWFAPLLSLLLLANAGIWWAFVRGYWRADGMVEKT